LDSVIRSIEAADLLHGDDHEFVVNAYLAILRRWPDEGGYHHYLRLITNRPERRIEVIRGMAGSEEARRAGSRISLGADPIEPGDPQRALATMLEVRTSLLHAETQRLRLALEELGGVGGPEVEGLRAGLMEVRDAEVRSEINAARREAAAGLEAVQEFLRSRGLPAGPAAEGASLLRRLEALESQAGTTAEALAGLRQETAETIARTVCDYVGDMLQLSEARTELRLRALEARLLGQGRPPAVP
jgi:hypothetical protein